MRASLAAVSMVCLVACRHAPEAIPGTTATFQSGSDMWDTPFPGVHRQGPDGRIPLFDFPNPQAKPWVDSVVDLAHDRFAEGSTTAPVIFPFDGDLDPESLPDPLGSLDADSPVVIYDLDAREPALATIAWNGAGGPYGPPRYLAVLPTQGAPLHAGHRYAVIVRRSLLDADGEPLGRSIDTSAILAGEPPEWMFDVSADAYTAAASDLEALGWDLDDIAAIDVFVPDDPTRLARSLRADLQTRLPTPSAFTLTDTFDTYCVYNGTVDLPNYQRGDPPYTADGGGIVTDVNGNPFVQHTETAAIWITVPRQSMPEGGFPTVVMIPTGGGGDRPLVDRGVHVEAHGAADPGTGPAMEFAQVGFAGASIDGPHGGLRNITHGDQQFLLFNIANPEAMLGNLDQSAAEVSVTPAILDQVTIDASDCPGVGSTAVTFDVRALFGHSMGATIAPTGAAFEPRYEALILSGAGGSWIENVIHKQSPLEVRPIAEAILGYTDGQLTETDPVLGLVQWAGEGVDPPAYRSQLALGEEGLPKRHVLMFQGIVDTYILPPIANPLSMALDLDRGGPAYDSDPRLAEYASTDEMLALVGRGPTDLPASLNRDGERTAVVVQHPEDGIEDGHETVFQTEAPKNQYRCFLESLLDGEPVVPGDEGCE